MIVVNVEGVVNIRNDGKKFKTFDIFKSLNYNCIRAYTIMFQFVAMGKWEYE